MHALLVTCELPKRKLQPKLIYIYRRAISGNIDMSLVVLDSCVGSPQKLECRLLPTLPDPGSTGLNWRWKSLLAKQEWISLLPSLPWS